MPEQEAGQVASQEWNQETVEKQAAELEQKEPEQKPEAEEAPVKEKIEEKAEKVVPLQALHEERARRREESQRAKALEQQLAQLAQQQQQLLARMTQPQQPVPDPAADPIGALVHGQQRTQAEIQQLRQEQYQRQAMEQAQNQSRQFIATVKAHEAEFAKQQPDYLNAVEFVKAARVKEYQSMGMSSQEAQERLLHDEQQLVQWAYANGENPAKVAFELAVARGYVSPKQKLEMQKEGQGASMPTGSGGKGGGDPTIEALLKMDPKDFAKATEGDKWEKLLRKYGG